MLRTFTPSPGVSLSGIASGVEYPSTPDAHCPTMRNAFRVCDYFLKRRRTAPAAPRSPVPKSNMLAGSGTATSWTA